MPRVTARTVPATDNASKVSYLDFARTISDSTIVRSSTVALTGISASFVAADLYVAFDINATLAESITITDNRSGDTVFTMQRHTGIAHIPCGDYTATVTLGDLTRSRVFRLIFTSDVIINMGN